MLLRRPDLPLQTEEYWSQNQCELVAREIFTACDLTPTDLDYEYDDVRDLEPAMYPSATSDVMTAANIVINFVMDTCGLASRFAECEQGRIITVNGDLS